MTQQFQDPNQASSPPLSNHYSAPSPSSIPAQSASGVVGVGSVAGQVAEYIEIPGKGAVKMAAMTHRLVARILDAVILGIALGVLMGIAVAIIAAAASVDDGSGSATGVGLLGFLGLMTIAMVVVYAYEAVMIGFWGATVGKMIMKVKVVKPRSGEAPGIGSGIVRYLIPGVCALIPFIGWLGTLACYVSPTFDSSGRRQGWHDKVANTVVVSTAV
ncbi:RDD family protein [Brachybacterium alimentarium]|uniref:RDD family protein n=1 Tax=Brachybacterium alimentarium TaxID=47845 RepID=UPI000DF27A6D|nr:RDD family protein [Brachybacterium alimentarium]RCS80647.1 RDD family protein [Brachybacterium alimentarium]